MNKRQVFLSICLFIVFFSLLSVASASDTTENVTVTAVSDDSNTISVTDNQDYNLGASSGFTGLNDTIAGSHAGDTITFNGSYTYSSSDGNFSEGIIIDKSITIDGQGYTINALKNASIFNILGNSKVILKNINFVNAYGDYGSAIRLDPSTHLEIINCNFNNNMAKMSGGAIYVSNSSSLTSNLIINGSTFNGNSARFGGAIYLNENSHDLSIIENSRFIKCTSDGDGGAAYISADNVELKNVVFDSNVAGDDGGAIYWQGNNGIIADITCTNNRGTSANTSSTRGGTICLTGSNVTVSNSKFKASSAYIDEGKDSSKVDGGALFVTGNDVKIKDVSFEQCGATNNGGALYVIGNNTEIIKCTFSKNTGSDGAALYVEGHDCKLYNSTFNDNTARDDGGAIFWNGNDGLMYNITCTNNKGTSYNDSSTRGGTICLTGDNVTVAKSSFTSSGANIDAGKDSGKVDGGALFVTGNNVVITDTLFTNCKAANNGGSMYVIGNDTEIINCNFKYTNTREGAAKDGGAVYVDGADCKMYNSTFSGLIANDDGGAIFWNGDKGYMYNITCTNNKGISYNDSSTRGGTICLTGNNVTVAKSSFTRSYANIDKDKDASKVDGGAIFITGNDVNIIETSFSQCSAAHDGGALYIIGNDTQIVNCHIERSSASDGGALFINGSRIKLLNSSTIRNSAENGGAIYIEGHEVVISDLQSSSNTANTRGGSIYVEGYGAYIDNSVFTNNEGLIGGAIYIAGDDVVVDNSTFKSNKGKGKYASDGGSGGAVYIDGEGATISGSDFDSNYAIRYGGAIAVWGAGANITSNSFKNSHVNEFDGGAIFVKGLNATISQSNFSKNKASAGKGGAIGVQGNNTHILDCNFTDSSAIWGGIIHVDGFASVIENSNFTNSHATEGGAIFLNGLNASILNSDFSKVYANTFGGAINVAGDYANISGCEFDTCTVNSNGARGGAIYIAGLDTNIEDSNFTSCKASGSNARGGAIDIEGHNTHVTDSIFEKCSAPNGGDIFVFGNNVKMQDSIFDSSTATNGGAIYIWGWGAVVENSNLTNCNASASGGAIYTTQSGGTNILSNNFDSCYAKGTAAYQGGGAIYVEGPNTHISDSNFTNNKATSGSARGGAIYIKGNETIVEKSYFNNSISNQGGVIHVEGENAIIDSSVFSNSSSKGSGGAISVLGNNAAIENSQFENFKAVGNGGAIYVNGKDTQILNSSFDNCTTTGYNNKGGVIFIDNVGTNVWYSNFTNSKSNTAGAIYINGKDTVISYCNLDNNTAHIAGAISVHGNDTILSNNNFTNNIATSGSGGALDIGGDNASVYYSYFDKNRASSNGGAINWDGGHGSDSIIGCTFTNNDCNNTMQGGGAIFWTAGEIGHIGAGGLIQDSIFVNNTANGRHGGAINWYHAKDSVINNCLFVNNTAASDGGALYTGHQTGGGFNLTMTNSQFYNNTARKHGGAIANQMEGSWIYNNTFDGNKAEASGGSILMKEGFAINSVIDHCYIYNSYVNQSYGAYGEGGGAIRIEDDNITITNSAIINSVANSTYGGAIYVKSTNASLINVTIQNVVTLNDNGGAIYWDGVNGYMKNVTIFNSSSNSRGDKDANGGAIYLLANNCNFTDISIASSSSNNPNNGSSKSANGGAIYVSGTGNTITNLTIDNVESSSANFKSDGGAIYWAGSSGSLINASISNTLANGEGGAIYWSGTSATVDNISIEYSQTNVTNSTRDANGGAIYSIGIEELTNVMIVDALASTGAGDIRGGAIYFANGKNMNNVTVVGSRASTGNGTSYGGAIYWKNDINDANINESSFVNNTADLGGAVYVDSTNVNVNDTLFDGNVAEEGGAFYGKGKIDSFDNASFVHNSAKRGGAIYTKEAIILISNSTLANNTAEQKGGAICHNRTSASDSSEIRNTNLTGNIAYQGSAIYANRFFDLTNAILLDNQANANKFINKTIGTNNITGENFTTAIFVGNDNLLNAMWIEGDETSGNCVNVTYLGSNGVEVFSGIPNKSNQDVYQNITVELYDEDGNFVQKGVVRTDANGMINYTFKGKPGVTYNFAYIHESDSYYTYLRDTLSNRSIVKVNVNDFYWGNSTTMYISLNDGAMGGLNGTVTVTFNDTNHTTLIINVTDGIYKENHTFPFDIGTYNVSAVFAGDLNHTGDTNWNLTHVLPFDDVEIIKVVNITADFVNVTDIVKYTINVTNHGPTMATGVNVTEILTPYLKLLKSEATCGKYNYTEGKWYIGNLNVGETVTLNITAQVIHVGIIANTAWVNSNGWDTNTSNDISTAHNFTALPIVDLRISKRVNTTKILNVTDKIEYVIDVYNYGPCNATGVVIGEILDPHLKMISSNATLGKYENGTWNIGNMDNGTNATLTIVAQIIYSGDILNEVNVTSFETDTNMSNNKANVTNSAIANVDLQITKTADVNDPVRIKDTITFTVSVYNAGPCNATGVYVSELIQYPLELLSSNVTIGKYEGGTWVINNLNKGEVHNLTIVARVIGTGNILNEVFITGSDNDTNLTNNYANYTNVANEDVVDLIISKEVNVSAADIGDSIRFIIKVYNAGPCNATGVKVTEVLCPCITMTGNVTENGYYNKNDGIWYIGNLNSGSTAVLTIIAQVITNGTISNVVVVTSNENDTNKSNNEANITNITVLPIVDVSIVKYLMNSTAYVGENIVYTIYVENKGPSNATQVTVRENISEFVKVIGATDSNYDMDAHVWYIGNLAKGDSRILILTVKVLEEGIVKNSVNVTSYENDTNMSNNNASASDILVIKKVEFEIIKTSNITADAYAGDLINFTITFTNIGPSNATNVCVNDELPQGLEYVDSGSSTGINGTAYVVGGKEYVRWNMGDFNVGEGAGVWVVVKALTNGTFVNVATVVPNEYCPNGKNETNVTVKPVADLQITKRAITTPTRDVVYIGDEITFAVDVHNNGPSNATGVVVNETVTGLVEIISFVASAGTSYDPVTGVWNIGNLASGGNAGLIINVKVIANGTVENFVSVSGNEKDSNMSNNNASSDNITALPLVDVSIVKYLLNSTAFVGENIVYTIYVENNGPSNATQVTVRENISEFVKVISATDPNYDIGTNVWYIGDLAKGDSRILNLTVKVLEEGIVKNSVNVTSHENDTNMSNNNASSDDILVIKKAEFEIIKTSNITSDAYAGDLINFTITFTNIGPSNATEVVVNDELPQGLEYVDSGSSTGKGTSYVVGGKEYVTWNVGDLDVGEGASVWVVVKAMTNGTFVNVAFVVPKEYSPNNRNETNVTVKPVADLQITKRAITIPARDVVYVGDEITFTVDVHNNGPSNATGVVVNETVTGLVEIINFVASTGTSYDPVSGVWTIGNLASRGNAGLIISVKVIANGTVENFVSVSGNEKDSNMSNNNASSDNITALPLVDVKVNKTVSVTEARIGDNITYTIMVQNNGPCDATNVNVTGKLSNNVAFVKYTAGQGNYDVTKNIWYVGKLTNGSIATMTLTVRALEVGTVENSVVVNSTEKDTNITNNNYTCENVTVSKLDTPIDLVTYNITYGDDENLIVTLPEGATGTVNITVGERNYTDVPIENGKVLLPVTDLGGGDYNVTVTYGGDGKYLPNSTSGIFNVAPVTPIITIEVEDIWVWEFEALNVTVNAPGSVFVTVNGITVEIPLENGIVTTDLLVATAKPDYHGNATWNIYGLPVGTYPAFALYPGNENYTSVNTSDVFHVRDLIPSNVVVTADDIYVGEDAIINIVVGPEGVTGDVTVNVGGKNYTVPLNNGTATLIVPGLPAGEKNVTVWYGGDIMHYPSENTTTFNVLKIKPPVDVISPEITVGEDGVITVKVPKDATGTITIEIEGKRYTAEINDGEAVFIIPGLKVGLHDIIAFYSGDDKYLPANTTGEIKVNPKEGPHDHNRTHKKSTIDSKLHATGNPVMALIAVLMSLCVVQIRRFKK